MEPPFGLDLVQRSTGDRLTGTPCLGKELRNQLLWLTSACLNLAKISIEKQGRTRSFSQKRSKMGVVFSKNGRGPKFFARASRAMLFIEPPSTNPASATAVGGFCSGPQIDTSLYQYEWHVPCNNNYYFTCVYPFIFL